MPTEYDWNGLSPEDMLFQALTERRSQEKRVITWADLRVRTRDEAGSPLVPFNLNDVQREYTNILVERYANTEANKEFSKAKLLEEPWRMRGLRENDLKSRQQGFSTYWLGMWFLAFYNLDYINAVIITHQPDTSNQLWARVLQWQKDMQAKGISVKLDYSNRRELVRTDTGSTILIGTAGQSDFGSGGTFTHIHTSETSKWPAGSETLRASIIPTLTPHSCLIEESTAKGMGAHYSRWVEQSDAAKSGHGSTHCYFVPWFKTKEYRTEPPQDFEPTEEETRWKVTFGLNDAQIYWYRRMGQAMKSEGKGEMLHQEYPFTPEDAFIGSTLNSRFNRRYLLELLYRIRARGEQGEVEIPGETAWHGVLTTYRHPEFRKEYVIVGDVAEGETDINEDPDYSLSHVYDVETWEQVAHYRGRVDTHNYGTDLATLGTMYNDALIVIERTGPGLSTLNTLENSCTYGNLYAHEDGRLGWPANSRTKKTTGDDLASIVMEMEEDGEEYGFRWNEPNTLLELIHYIRKPGSKEEAETGHDDEVTCCRMAAMILPRITTRRKILTPESEPDPPRIAYAVVGRRR